MNFRSKEAGSPATPSTTTTPAPAIATTPTSTGGAKGAVRKSRVPALSESESSDFEGTPNPAKSTHHPDQTTTSHALSPHDTTDRLETHDRMSKEKQKFFRLSAFNSDKKKEKKLLEPKNQSSAADKVKRNGSKERDEAKSVTPPEKVEKSVALDKKNEVEKRLVKKAQEPVKKNEKVTPKTKNGKINAVSEKAKRETTPQPTAKLPVKPKQDKSVPVKKKLPLRNQKNSEPEEVEKPEEKEPEEEDDEDEDSSSSSDTSSSSSCSSDSDDSDSSVIDSDSRTSIRNLKIPQLYSAGSEKKETFGSISGITVDKDAPWGFAAAAAEAQKKATDKTDAFAFGNDRKSENLFITVLKEEGFLKEDKDDSSLPASEKSCSDRSQKAQPGFGQLKGLFDGLSHLFAPPTVSRASRTQPNYNPNRRKPKEDSLLEEKKAVEDRPLEKRIMLDDRRQQSRFRANSDSYLRVSRPSPSPSPASHADEHGPPSAMTPSGLVKTAVNSKQHERRKLVKSEGVGAPNNAQKTNGDDVRTMKKRNHVAAGHAANPLSAPPFTNNQTGKIGYPYLPPYLAPIPLYTTTTTPAPPPTTFYYFSTPPFSLGIPEIYRLMLGFFLRSQTFQHFQSANIIYHFFFHKLQSLIQETS